MRENSPWEDIWCEFCGERIHHSRIEQHKRMVHSLELEADLIISKPSWREIRGTVIYASFILLIVVVLGILEWISEFDYPWWYGYLMVGLAVSILPAMIVMHFRSPPEEKERTQRAWEILRACKVKCEICEQKIAWGDYWSHLKSQHPGQVSYEWFRALSLIAFLVDFLGGMVAVFFMIDSHDFSDESLAAVIALWATSVSVFIFWALYMSQIGERRHIKKMREKWQRDRFLPRDSLN